MRTLRIAVALATAVAMTGLLPATPASAAVPNVLTYGGGLPVVVGNILTSPLAPFTTATFTTGPNGTGIGTTCTTSNITGSVVANPISPGTATVKINTQTFTGCTSTIPGVTLVTSVVVNNLPYNAMFSDATGLPVTIVPIGGPIQITINETFGTAISCVWQLNSSVYHGNYINIGSKAQLLNQQDHLIAGPGSGCGTTAQFINVTYAPFIDSSVAPANQVFVN